MRILSCPPLPLLWSGRPPDGTPSSRIHKIFLRGLWRKPWPVRLGIALSFLAWPFIVFTSAVAATTVNGRAACQRQGRRLATLFVEQIWFAARHGILPPRYFIYELEDPERQLLAPAYINRYEAKGGLFRLLRCYAGSLGDKTLNDKIACDRACRAAGLATPEIFVELRDGQAQWTANRPGLPERDLFSRPVRGPGGAAAERWLRAAPGRWRNGKGEELDEPGLLERFRRLSRRGPLLVQSRMRNHPALDDLNCGALATLHVLSIWDEQRRPEVTNAALKMPARQGCITDSLRAGGIAAAVDLTTGRLGPATNFGQSQALRWFDTHPVTGTRIEGYELPMWPEVIAFCRRLHETFITFPVISFDIAITPGGPCLIGTSVASPFDMIQRTLRAPIGDARFGTLFALHLENAEAWQRGADSPPALPQGNNEVVSYPPMPRRALPSRKTKRRGLANLRPLQLGKWVLLSAASVAWARLPAGDQAALRIHREFRRILAREPQHATRLRRGIGFLIAVPIAALLDVYFTAKQGRSIARRTGKGLLRQGYEQLVLAVRYAIPSYYYYDFEFWDDRKRAQALSYIYRFELKGRGIYALLRNRYSSPETTEALSNKAAFALRCDRHRVPVVPVLAVAENGGLKPLNPNAEPLPPTSLFVKPLRGSGGGGASAWHYRAGGTWRSNSGLELTASGLREHLCKISIERPYIMRPLASNHCDLRGLSSGALSTVRVLTCLDENGRPEVTNALFKMSIRPEAIVDNYHAGGIAAKVDLATGMLSAATKSHRVWHNHPVTGAAIEGAVLPMWGEVLDLARRGHAIFGDQIAIGWDIAILDDGPRLVEGNKGPGVDSIQMTLGGPLGSARFGELLAFHLERAVEPGYDGRAASEPERRHGT